MPGVVKDLLTGAYIPYRRIMENSYAARLSRQLSPTEGALRVVYLSGFPRTGTTALKYYFADYPGLVMFPFDPAGFFKAWQHTQTISDSEIVVDKSNHYVQAPDILFRGLGQRAALCVIVRDPRDSLLSLQSFTESREAPRDIQFWDYWARTYSKFLKFASTSQFGKRVFLLRYEDFISNPCAAKRRYLGWIGIDPTVVEITNQYPLPERREFLSDKVHAYTEIKAGGIERWKDFAGSSDVSVLLNGWREHSDARQIMERLGYGPDGIVHPILDHSNFNFFDLPNSTDAQNAVAESQ